MEQQIYYKTKSTLFLEWISIVGPVLACVVFLHGEIKSLDNKIEKQGARTDKLYEMFIDLLKESRNG